MITRCSRPPPPAAGNFCSLILGELRYAGLPHLLMYHPRRFSAWSVLTAARGPKHRYCQREAITVEAYSPLGHPNGGGKAVYKIPQVLAIAKVHGKT
jgi:hypothetical protein